MTVCVAAIAQFSLRQADGSFTDEPVVIFASDRMITVGDKREYEMASQTKMFPVSNFASILISGSGESLLEVSDKARTRIHEEGTTLISEMANIVREEFILYRNEYTQHRVLSQYNLDWNSFYDRMETLPSDFRNKLVGEIESLEYDLGSIMLLGVDELSAHIYIVSDPGEIRSRLQSGYAAIGIGAEFAAAEFMAAGYTPYFRWELALWLTYSAKKRAEVAAGVGQLTDLYWITRNGRAQFGPGTDFEAKLADVFKQRTKAEDASRLEDTQAIMRIWEGLNATPQAQQAQPPADEQGAVRGGLEEGQPQADSSEIGQDNASTR